jgi:hypothetical protein
MLCAALMLCCAVQLRLSWLKWLLPAGLFRRGFDQQQEQQEQQEQQQDSSSSARAPLLPAAQQQQADELQDVWHEAVDKLQHNGGDVKVCTPPCGLQPGSGFAFAPRLLLVTA